MTNSENLSDINLFKNNETNPIQKHGISGLSGLNQYMGRVWGSSKEGTSYEAPGDL